jgi:hypothetical protein
MNGYALSKTYAPSFYVEPAVLGTGELCSKSPFSTDGMPVAAGAAIGAVISVAGVAMLKL